MELLFNNIVIDSIVDIKYMGIGGDKMDKKKILLVMLALTVLVNIVAYNYLPQEIAAQITISGEKANYISKPIYLIAGPVILLGIYLFTRSMDKEKEKGYFFTGVIIFMINIVFILINL